MPSLDAGEIARQGKALSRIAEHVIIAVPFVEDAVSWRWAFVLLAPGPALGMLAMLRLRAAPEARLIAGGRG